MVLCIIAKTFEIGSNENWAFHTDLTHLEDTYEVQRLNKLHATHRYI